MLCLIGPAGEGEKIGAFDLGVVTGTGFTPDSLGKHTGRLDGERAIEQAQRLRRDCGDGTARAARVGIRPVESLEKRISKIAPDEGIKTPSILILCPGGDRPDLTFARKPG